MAGWLAGSAGGRGEGRVMIVVCVCVCLCFRVAFYVRSRCAFVDVARCMMLYVYTS